MNEKTALLIKQQDEERYFTERTSDTRRKLGEILTETGLITKEQLENALMLQRGKKKKLGQILVEVGYVSTEQITQQLSKQLSILLVDCNKYTPSKQLLSLIPRETAEHKLIYPLEQNNKGLMIAMADPLDYRTIDDLSFQTGSKITVAIASEINILNAIERNYGSSDVTWEVLNEIPAYSEVEFVKEEVKSDEKQGISFHALFKDSAAPPIVKLVTMIIADADNFNASDIHIEPREKHVQVRYRIDGELKNILGFPVKIRDSVISRIKIIANMDITNRRFPQDGRSAIRLKNKTVDLRISTLPSVYGENIVIRLLDSSTGLIALSKLGISDKTMRPLIEIINQPQGMLLVTGPTGSGKTTTLYSILQQLKSEAKNIITLEDPVEYKIADITQVGINEGIGFTFTNALRSVLRQDPDIVLVGEMRDLDTAEIAVRAALTGHLVLSTLHTNNTVSTITRLIDIGLEPFLVNSAVSGIIAQRLARKICPECKTRVPLPDEAAGLYLPSLKECYRGAGCSRCGNTGFKGRVGVYELLKMDVNLKRLISNRATEDELWDYALESGTKTMFEDAWQKVNEGIMSVEEVISKVPNKHHSGNKTVSKRISDR